MNIIEVVKQILTACSLITEFTNDIHVDFTEGFNAGEYGIYPMGDSLVKKDVLGNQKRQHNFVLYANNQSFNDYDRLQNSSFLLDLNYWLETVKGHEVTATINGVEHTGEITKMWSANGMLFSRTDNTTDSGTYQLQIYAQYTLKE